MRYFYTREILLVLMVIAWILYYRHGIRLAKYYREQVESLSELFTRYKDICAGKELSSPKELSTEMFWVTYDPDRLDRFFFSLECVISEIDKTYDKLSGYCCYLGNRRWEEVKALCLKTQLISSDLRYMKWEKGFLGTPRK